jgi:hypothetical protein
VIVTSFLAVLPISRDSKSHSSLLTVIKGYFPMALTLRERVSSYPLETSYSFTRISATCTFASSA